MEFKCNSTNKASERLVAVNFKGLLPCYIAHEIMNILQDKVQSCVGDIEYREDVYNDDFE